jgi:GTP cyclohydrolase I
LNYEIIEKCVKNLLDEIGEDSSREGLQKTPHRVAKAYEFFTQGYNKDIKKILNGAIFIEKYDEMVIVKDIDFYSMCEHHLLPFFGKMHIAYIPNGKIVGLSKIPRIVDVFAQRLQVQERMTQEIADTIEEYLNPRGVAVVAEGYHMCMMMRGVQKQNSITTTSAMHGTFTEDARTRSEFLNLISKKI